MRSLRGRLVAIVLLIATVGLVVLASITYAEQRSFLTDRVDRQLQAAFGAAGAALAIRRVIVTGGEALPANPFGEFEPGEDSSGRGRGSDQDGGSSEPQSAPLPGPDPAFNLPPGTFGAVLDSQGNILRQRVFAFESGKSDLPDIAGKTLGREPQTVGASGDDDDTQFRVAADRIPGGGSIVVAIPLTEKDQTLNRLLLVEGIVIAAILAALGIASWILVGIGLRPLDRMARTADEIVGGDVSQRVAPADEDSEIGRLGLALNRMLARIETSFRERQESENRLRQFLADASHELRTPLVSIRGYAELHRLGATPEPAEVDRSMERIESESERMGVLVEDMLTLARLDETKQRDFADVDVDGLARDAVRNAEVAAPGRAIVLASDGPRVVHGDAHQLQQVLANLLTNAIVHTPDDTPIDVSVAADGPGVRIEVRDHGPGLPHGVGDQLFERFWRAEGGRVRGKAGSGLGLSIVAGIVDAHGGSVAARNAETGGAVFSVWLPLTQADR